MNITLYSIGCPICKVCEKKLQAAGFDFELIDDKDVVINFGNEHGIKSAPIMDVDGDVYDSKAILQWIKEQQVNE